MSHEEEKAYPGFSGRLQFISVVLALCMLILILRLWTLQIVKWDEYRSQSNSNRLRPQRLESPRGMIYGRNGLDERVILADNRAARDLMFVLADCNVEGVVPELVCQRLEQLLHIDGKALLSEIEASEKANQPHKQILIKRDIPVGVSARVEEYAYALPGVFTVIRPVRRYVYGKTGGQVVGYLGEINQKQLDARKDRYVMGDLIGQSGVERKFEARLHGKDGEMLVTQYARGVPQLRTDPYGNVYVEMDSLGHNLFLEDEIVPAEPGGEIQITLDIGLQAKAEELLKGEAGAIVVLNADTGEVLTLASSPGYDPSVFVSPQGGRERQELLTGKPNRMINRAFQEVYPPGSTYKILLAAAALEEGVIDRDTAFTCYGGFRLSNVSHEWNCWKRGGHGKVSVVDALAFSCDVFFYNVGRELEVDRIKAWSLKFSLGERTGLDLPGEQPGLIPSPAWKRAVYKNLVPDDPSEWNWYPGETINLSIGQGSCAATPLQIAVLMSSVVNGGYRVEPNIEDGSTGEKTRVMSEETVALIREGMRKCVEKGPPAPTGTGHAAYIEGMEIIGKTGSAQVVSLEAVEEYAREEDIPKELRDHAWFMTGVLDREPRIAMCILVEHGLHGSSVAAPLAKEMIEYFYASRERPAESELAQRAADGYGGAR
ncbi:MAG TPA: penicillin-binding protein 2 [Candidatus Hydrogenedentes bacterium]|nr:penicillin-binding protein 2 [Candidatus Hydrogenedentota bacterium]